MKARKIIAIIMLSVSLTVGCASQDKTVKNSNNWTNSEISKAMNENNYYADYIYYNTCINDAYNNLILELRNSDYKDAESENVKSYMLELYDYKSSLLSLEPPEIIDPIHYNIANNGLENVTKAIVEIEKIDETYSSTDIDNAINSSLNLYDKFLNSLYENAEYVRSIYIANK